MTMPATATTARTIDPEKTYTLFGVSGVPASQARFCCDCAHYRASSGQIMGTCGLVAYDYSRDQEWNRAEMCVPHHGTCDRWAA